ncbi:MAG: hypothetical protein ACFFEF_18760 [Candidatus Thorarchaeota archaeon]
MRVLGALIVGIMLLSLSCSVDHGQAFAISQSMQPNALWIETSKLAISSSDSIFNATIWINVTESTYAWQTKIHFNTTFLNISGAGYTYGNRSVFFSEYTPISISPIINYDEGYIIFGESLLENEQRAPGHGSLAWVEFELTDVVFQTNFTQNISMQYGIDTFVLNPLLETISFDTVQGATISLQYFVPTTTTTPTPPTTTPIPTEMLIIVVGVSLVLVIGIIVLRRRRLRVNE